MAETLPFEWQAVLQIGHAGDAIHQASIVAYWANAEPSVRRMHMDTIAEKAAEVAQLIECLRAIEPAPEPEHASEPEVAACPF